MPASKHHRKKTPNSKLRRAKNIRKAINKFEEGKEQKKLRQSPIAGDLAKATKRFARVFPDRILKKAYKDIT